MFSQNDSITGSYYQSSGNPEGGTTTIVLPNNTFVVGYFGGMRKGTWKLIKNDAYKFTYHVEPKFVLYGRHNSKLKDSVAISMSIDGNKGVSVRFNGSSSDAFTPVFNKGANCFDYPYIYKQKEKLNSLEAFAPDYSNYLEGKLGDLPGFYSFKIEEDYNEFILAGLSEEYSEAGSFKATYKNGILSLGADTDLKKSGQYEDLDEETLSFIKSHIEIDILPKLLEYGNEFFPHYENPMATDLIPFTRLESQLNSSKAINIEATSLFIATCED